MASVIILEVKCDDVTADQVERVLTETGGAVRTMLNDLLDTGASVSLTTDDGLHENF